MESKARFFFPWLTFFPRSNLNDSQLLKLTGQTNLPSDSSWTPGNVRDETAWNGVFKTNLNQLQVDPLKQSHGNLRAFTSPMSPPPGDKALLKALLRDQRDHGDEYSP